MAHGKFRVKLDIQKSDVLKGIGDTRASRQGGPKMFQGIKKSVFLKEISFILDNYIFILDNYILLIIIYWIILFLDWIIL